MASPVNRAGENHSTHNPAMNRRAREKADLLTCVETLAGQFALRRRQSPVSSSLLIQVESAVTSSEVNGVVSLYVEEKIKSFLAERLMIRFDQDIDENSDLFQLGLVDSRTYVELIRFVENEFKLKFTNEEILSNILVSFSGIVSLVADAMDRRIPVTPEMN
jgi:acyl carrier protein